MIVIGLTGSVGMGKSEVTKYLKRKNIDVFDSDKEIDQMYKTRPVLKQIQKAFPGIIDKNTINKTALAKIVFNNKKKLKKLETILYDRLTKNQHRWIRKKISEKKKVVVFDVPLLFEKNNIKKYDLIIVVSCSKYIQKIRVLKRKNWDSERFENVLEKQINNEKKIKSANLIIRTDRGKRVLYKSIIKIKNLSKVTANRRINIILKQF